MDSCTACALHQLTSTPYGKQMSPLGFDWLDMNIQL